MAYDTTANPSRAESGFSIGAVFARCIRTYQRRFVSFCLVTFAIAVPVEAALVMTVAAIVMRHKTGENPLVPYSFIAPAFAFLLYLALYAAQSALYGSAYRDMSGAPPALGRSVRDGLIRLPIVIVAAIISWLVVTAGSVALAFPGIIVFTMTAVTGPACVIERSGPFAAMSRSTVLTKGHRWRIFAIYLIEIIGGYGCFAGGQVILEALLPRGLSSIFLIALQTVLIAFTTVLNTAVYFELRVAKEGNARNEIAAVFD